MEVHTPITSFIVGTLAVWRVTHLLWAEDGPLDVLVRLRKFAGASFFGRLLDCFYCLSLWVSVPMAWLLATGWTERAIVWLGLSGGVVILQRLTTRTPSAPPPAIWHETTKVDKQE
jgi:Protein of unknown function (DUF1360)